MTMTMLPLSAGLQHEEELAGALRSAGQSWLIEHITPCVPSAATLRLKLDALSLAADRVVAPSEHWPRPLDEAC